MAQQPNPNSIKYNALDAQGLPPSWTKTRRLSIAAQLLCIVAFLALGIGALVINDNGVHIAQAYMAFVDELQAFVSNLIPFPS